MADRKSFSEKQEDKKSEILAFDQRGGVVFKLGFYCFKNGF